MCFICVYAYNIFVYIRILDNTFATIEIVLDSLYVSVQDRFSIPYFSFNFMRKIRTLRTVRQY